MTLDDLERPIRTLAEKMRFTEPARKKISTTIDSYHQRQKRRPIILLSRERYDYKTDQGIKVKGAHVEFRLD